MSQTLRHPEILDLARREGRVTVEGLARHFGVTVQTVRRDLAELAQSGQLARVHGGAVLPSPGAQSSTANIGYGERRRLQSAEKRAIAQACAALVPQEAALFLGIGTTTEAVARELGRHKGLLVATNNMNVANILLENPDCEVVLVGGSIRRSDGGIVGTLAVQAIRQFKFDLCVLGCSGLDADGDVLDFDLREAGVNQAILGQSRGRILVADHTKLGRSAPVRVASLSEVGAWVTDRPPEPALAALCEGWGTRVVVAGPPG